MAVLFLHKQSAFLLIEDSNTSVQQTSIESDIELSDATLWAIGNAIVAQVGGSVMQINKATAEYNVPEPT